jgi:lipopolysaccharide/colanic/teichoic acid biosynthesis glycosyltransferase
MGEHSIDVSSMAVSPFWKSEVLDRHLIRLADILGAILCLCILAPVFPLIAFLIRLESCGPTIFKQKRPGENGVVFTIYKFRTMYDGSDKLLRCFRTDTEPVMKIPNDCRVTRVGRFLRKFSVDEFPQLVNILKGNMSLVGPRPPLLEEFEAYDEHQKERLACKPGLSGLAQINGRSDLHFDKILEYDIFYAKNRSFSLYVKILLKTIPYCISCKSSY